ncbi:MAG: DUF6765 family protein [Smithellaceae bacterium]|jgi:hypothetical protein
MDQDFHYYGTHAAALTAGVPAGQATRLAKAANYVDFLNETRTRGYWRLIFKGPDGKPRVTGRWNSPRYTFQNNMSGTGFAPAIGLWQSFHFLPGNYLDNDLTVGQVDFNVSHAGWFTTQAAASKLPVHHTRPADTACKNRKLLTRPLSAASRALVMDSATIWNDDAAAEDILLCSPAAKYLLPRKASTHQAILTRFKEMVVGVRAHVIADTWAHQDFAGLNDQYLNTYYDASGNFCLRPGGQDILLDTGMGRGFETTHLWGVRSGSNLVGAPGTAALGHGWMGHLPDMSWIQYRYIPSWSKDKKWVITRNNRQTYIDAFHDLVNYFQKVLRKSDQLPEASKITKAKKCIGEPLDLKVHWGKGRPFHVHSAEIWRSSSLCSGVPQIDTCKEPSKAADMQGKITTTLGASKGSYGTYSLEMTNDLPGHDDEDRIPDMFLFQIAADYHLIFIKTWLESNKISDFSKDSWATDECVLCLPAVEDIVRERFTTLNKPRP